MNAQTVLTTVSTVDPIRVTFGISEREYLRFAASINRKDYATTERGPELELVLADGSVFPEKGKAVLVDREVDPRTGTMTVRGFFPNPAHILRPGQYAKVRAALETRVGALLVPQRAVMELQGGYHVGVVGADGKVELRSVTPGTQIDGMWVIEQGVKPGESVIVTGPAVRAGGHAGEGETGGARSARRPGSALGHVPLLHRPADRRDRHLDPDGRAGPGGRRRPADRAVPAVIPPQIEMQATYTGADALTVEQSVATPIEQQMNGVDKMLYMQSINANDGTMTLSVTFDVGTDIDIDQVQRAEPRGAGGAQPAHRGQRVRPHLPLRRSACRCSCSRSTRRTAPTTRTSSATTSLINVNDELSRVPGIGQVMNFGAADYAMRIWVKPDPLAKLGLTVTDLVQRDHAAERRQSGRHARRRAGAARPAAHVHGARAGPAGRPRRSSATSSCA